jgi:hypothetical protein
LLLVDQHWLLITIKPEDPECLFMTDSCKDHTVSHADACYAVSGDGCHLFLQIYGQSAPRMTLLSANHKIAGKTIFAFRPTFSSSLKEG